MDEFGFMSHVTYVLVASVKKIQITLAGMGRGMQGPAQSSGKRKRISNTQQGSVGSKAHCNLPSKSIEQGVICNMAKSMVMQQSQTPLLHSRP